MFLYSWSCLELIVNCYKIINLNVNVAVNYWSNRISNVCLSIWHSFGIQQRIFIFYCMDYFICRGNNSNVVSSNKHVKKINVYFKLKGFSIGRLDVLVEFFVLLQRSLSPMPYLLPECLTVLKETIIFACHVKSMFWSWLFPKD